MVRRSAFSVQGSGFRVQGSGFGVLGAGVLEFGRSEFQVSSSPSELGTVDAWTRSMGARRYRELHCWQLANELKRKVYALIAKPLVASDRDFCDQIRDSVRGGPRAIAEGFGRFRPADFGRYLEYARASLIETQNHIDDALDSAYVSEAEHKQLWDLADRAVGATTSLHGYLRTQRDLPSTGYRKPKRERSTPDKP
jgi:four helix bundle protein